MAKGKNNLIYQFKISLAEIEPTIWRRIQVPADFNFWDLHVAVQDSMGWLDYHLHEFRIPAPLNNEIVLIGIPDDEWGEVSVMPGWEVPIAAYLTEPGQKVEYEYDFGDSWNHEILFEAILDKKEGSKYPKCLAGERACPPEDCGSVPGYYNLLEVLSDPTGDEYEDIVAWLEGEVTRYLPFSPDKFDPQAVEFDSPKKRWKIAFAQDGDESGSMK